MPRNGFTLVELMITIAVLALLTSVVSLTVGVSDDQPRTSAERFASRLAAARNEAVLTARPISAWVSPSGYGFDQRRAGRWVAMTERPLTGDDWGSGIRLAAGSPESAGPQRVRFDPVGLPDRPLALLLEHEGRRVEIRINANGEVSVQ